MASCCASIRSKLPSCSLPKLGEVNKKEAAKKALGVTMIVVSVLAMTVAIIATLVHFNVVTDNSVFGSLGKMGGYAAGALTTVTVIANGLLAKAATKKACEVRAKKIADKKQTGTVDVQGSKYSYLNPLYWLGY